RLAVRTGTPAEMHLTSFNIIRSESLVGLVVEILVASFVAFLVWPALRRYRLIDPMWAACASTPAITAGPPLCEEVLRAVPHRVLDPPPEPGHAVGHEEARRQRTRRPTYRRRHQRRRQRSRRRSGGSPQSDRAGQPSATGARDRPVDGPPPHG